MGEFDWMARAHGACELCGGEADLAPLAVAEGGGAPEPVADGVFGAAVCAVCRPQIAGEAPLDAPHWRCLEGAIWSEVPAVQVLAWRLLTRLAPEHGWAASLLDQAFLAEEVLAWAQAGLEPTDGDAPAVGADGGPVDANGTPLASGDSVSLIKSLDVKGTGFVAKRGTVVRNIRVTDDPTHIEGRVNNVSIYLKTCFLKRVT